MDSISNLPTTSSTTDRSHQKRKKKSPPSTKWRSEKQQQIYTTKLARALTELGITRNGRAVREVADRALAVTARGKTLWSRAILSRAIKLKFRKRKRQRISNPCTSPAITTGSLRWKKQRATVMASVGRKVKVLSRLVPGCGKQTLPVVLEETTDYIAAMEMQIRTMTAVLNAVTSPTGREGGQTHVFG